jgi:hypothetical protein
MTYNAADRKDIRRAEKAAKVHETMRVDFLVAAMSHKQGRAWFHEHLSRCHMFATSFTGDPLTSAFAEGERNVGLQTYSDVMAHCPDMFVLMMQEAHERELTNGRRTKPDDNDGTDDDPDSTAGEQP